MTPAQDSSNDPWRRSIYRPNAQRLSISLAPLVAQRSLLFRIKAELAGVQSYNELEDGVEESPLLYSVTPSASANILSTIDKVLPSTKVGKPLASTVLSAASQYSQESWKLDSSKPTIPILNADARRHAMAFSPSVNWDEFSSLGEIFESHLQSLGGLNRRTIQTPRTPMSARLKLNITPVEGQPNENRKSTESVVGAVRVAEEPHLAVAIRRRVMDTHSTSVEKEDADGSQRSSHTPPSIELIGIRELPNATLPGSQKTMQQRLRKRKDANTEDDEDHSSTKFPHRWTLSKAFGRLAKQAEATKEKAESDGEQVSRPTNRSLRLSKLLLPELQISPIRMVFDLSPIPSPVHPNPPAGTIVEPEIRPTNSLNPNPSIHTREHPSESSIRSSITAGIPPVRVTPDTVGREQTPRRTTFPTPLPDIPPVPPLPAHIEWRTPIRASHEAPPSTPHHRRSVAPVRKKHRRTLSSPAVPKFDFHNRKETDIPPLPPLPKLPMTIPKAKRSPGQEQTEHGDPTVASLSKVGKQPLPPPPRPPRSKRPPGHTRVHSQPMPFAQPEDSVDGALEPAF